MKYIRYMNMNLYSFNLFFYRTVP